MTQAPLLAEPSSYDDNTFQSLRSGDLYISEQTGSLSTDDFSTSEPPMPDTPGPSTLAIAGTSDGHYRCDRCEISLAYCFCESCDLRYCKSCSHQYHVKGALKTHQIILEGEICDQCEMELAVKACADCDLRYCKACAQSFHSLGTLTSHKLTDMLTASAAADSLATALITLREMDDRRHQLKADIKMYRNHLNPQRYQRLLEQLQDDGHELPHDHTDEVSEEVLPPPLPFDLFDDDVPQGSWWETHPDERQWITVGISSTVVYFLGVALYIWIEGLSTTDAFYFIMVTLTTAGYGDISPTTPAGKVVTCFYSVAGIITFGAILSLLSGLAQKKAAAAAAAVNLPKGTADAFCTVSWAGAPGLKKAGIFTSTPVGYYEIAPCKGTLNPEWPDEKGWTIPLSSHVDSNGCIHVEVWDWDRLGDNDQIGSIDLPTENISTEFWQETTMEINVLEEARKPGCEDDEPPTLTVQTVKNPLNSKIKLKVVRANNLPVMDEIVGADAIQGGLDATKDLFGALIVLLIVILLGGVIFSFSEKWRYFDAVWYSFITLVTVGYGDFYPTTQHGKWLFLPFAVVSIAAGGYIISVIQSSTVQAATQKFLDMKEKAAQAEDDDWACTARLKEFWQTPVGAQVATNGFSLALTSVLLLAGTLIAPIENWTFLDGLYFSVVTLTTVGYGDMSPVSDGGKWFELFYILIGISLVSATISILAEGVIEEASVGNKAKRRVKNDEEPAKVDYFLLAKTSFTFIVFISVGSSAFYFVEGDNLPAGSLGNCVYYCIITMTTIGYGDIYPITDGGKLLCMTYIFLSLALFAYTLNTFQEQSSSALSDAFEARKKAKQELDIYNLLKDCPASVKAIFNSPEFAESCEQKFAAADEDHSGELDMDEVRAVLVGMYEDMLKKLPPKAAIPPPPDDETVESFIEKFDEDDSGTLDIEEFTNFTKLILLTAMMQKRGGLHELEVDQKQHHNTNNGEVVAQH